MRVALLLVLSPLVARAQLVLDEPFSTSPTANGWTVNAQMPLGLEALVLDGGVVGNAWQVSQPGGGAGTANRAPCRVRSFDAGTSTEVYARYWVRTTGTNTTYGPYPLILQSPRDTIAEVRFVGSAQAPLQQFGAVLQAVNASGSFIPCVEPSTTPRLQPNTWMLVELAMNGVGTDAGLARYAIDGQLRCSLPIDWTNRRPVFAFIGLCATELGYAGAFTLDELRIGVRPLASTLRLRADASVTATDCVAFEFDAIDSFTGQAAELPRDVSITALSLDGGRGPFTDSNCTNTVSAQLTLPASGGLRLYARPADQDVISLSARAADLLGSQTVNVQVVRPDAGDMMNGDAGRPDAGLTDAGLTDAGLTDAGLTDAGLTDAGLTDAGLTDAGLTDAGLTDAGLTDAGSIDLPGPSPEATYDVGCGCRGTSGGWFSILVALSWRRRGRRDQRPDTQRS